MTEAMSTTQNTNKPNAPQLFSDALIDQLLAQVQDKDRNPSCANPGWQPNRTVRAACPGFLWE